jgi:hypothetical protein
MSAIESAPVSIPATSAVTFAPAGGPGAARHRQVRISQLGKPGLPCQTKRPNQPGSRHKTRIVEPRSPARIDMR